MRQSTDYHQLWWVRATRINRKLFKLLACPLAKGCRWDHLARLFLTHGTADPLPARPRSRAPQLGQRLQTMPPQQDQLPQLLKDLNASLIDRRTATGALYIGMWMQDQCALCKPDFSKSGFTHTCMVYPCWVSRTNFDNAAEDMWHWCDCSQLVSKRSACHQFVNVPNVKCPTCSKFVSPAEIARCMSS